MLRFKMYRQSIGLLGGGQWRWRLLAANNKIIADSGKSYHNESDCRHGISLVMSTSILTPIDVIL